MKRQFKRGGRWHQGASNRGSEDLRAKINRLRNEREIPSYEECINLHAQTSNNDDDESLSLSLSSAESTHHDEPDERPPSPEKPPKKKSKSDKKKKKKKKRKRSTSPRRDSDSLSSLPSLPSVKEVQPKSPDRRRSYSSLQEELKQKSPDRRRRSFSPRSPEPHYSRHRPPKRRYDFPNPPRRPFRKRYPPRDRQSWEDKVTEFMNKIGTSDPTENLPIEEPSCDSISLTPLMKFVALKLSKKKKVKLVLTGVFQYSILSLLSRAEWVAARSIQLLEQAGYDNDWLYDNRAIKGDEGLKTDLVEAVKGGKVEVGKDKAATDQLLRIVGYIVKYFTSDGQESEAQESEDENLASDNEPAEQHGAGLGAVLNRISSSQQAPPAPPVSDHDEINHWSMLADNIQSTNLRSFEPIESYLSQDLLRVTTQNKDNSILLTVNGRPAKDAFEVARHMVMCWVNAGYSFEQLWGMVNAANAEDILPPRDPNDNSGFFIGPRLTKDKDCLAHKFMDQFEKMNKSMNSRQIDYVVWKSLLFVMRGCGKMINNTAAHSYRVAYNYLPPGLRELEAKSKFGPSSSMTASSSVSKGNNYMVDLPADIELSEDPMNIIIDPNGVRTKVKGETIPRRKYFITSIHVEYVMCKGKPEVYEIGIYSQDMSKLELFVAPDALKNEPATLEALGFTLNKNLNRYFFVQSNIGCVSAKTLKKAVEEMVEYLEKKRLAGDENQNNGLIILCKNQGDLSAFMNILNLCPDLTLNTIKGFGLLDAVGQLGDIQINMLNNDVCFSAQVLTSDRSEEVLAKSKPEVVFKALEGALQVCNPGYDSFIQPHCFPTDGSRVRHLKTRAKQIEAMYDLELFIAAELKMNNVEVFLEGIYAKDHNDKRHKCDVVAGKFCQSLVDTNMSMDVLQAKFTNIAVFAINPDLILNQMDKPQRLKVINQTRACIDFVRRYFRSSKQ